MDVFKWRREEHGCNYCQNREKNPTDKKILQVFFLVLLGKKKKKALNCRFSYYSYYWN